MMSVAGIPKVISAGVINALTQLCNRDHWLLQKGLHEQTISSRLAAYLQHEFPLYNVDCEYNKHLSHEKWIGVSEEIDLGRPDIVVHSRGTDNRNLLVIEIKKFNADIQDADKDKDRLRALTTKTSRDVELFRYHSGLFLELNADDRFRITWFVNGHELSPTLELTAISSIYGMFWLKSTRITNT